MKRFLFIVFACLALAGCNKIIAPSDSNDSVTPNESNTPSESSMPSESVTPSNSSQQDTSNDNSGSETDVVLPPVTI